MSSPAQPTPEDLEAEGLARDIAAEMPSPYCPGRSIASCPSEAARELEDDIIGLARQGKDREQIESILVDRFGEEKMGSAQQGEILLTIILGAALALGLIIYAARKWLRPSTKAGATAAGASAAGPLLAASPAELDRLEDELDELDDGI